VDQEEIANIAKIAGNPPQQTKIGLAGDPVAKIENQKRNDLATDESSMGTALLP
jgi:hypothetical protein